MNSFIQYVLATKLAIIMRWLVESGLNAFNWESHKIAMKADSGVETPKVLELIQNN